MQSPLPRAVTLSLTVLLCAFARVCPAQESAAAAPPKTPEPVRVMILGVYHFANPGLDLHNMKTDDMLAAGRQEELADVANRLAKFAPTKIAVESSPTAPDYSDASYQKFTTADLGKNANETVQVAYRLAHQLGHQAVYDIDEQSESVDYFPFGAVDEYAKAHRQSSVIEKISALAEQKIAEAEASQKTMPVRLMLALFNDPARIADENRQFYYSILGLADQQNQPGAVLNAMWYMRNAKIFAKLLQVAKPGDRIVVVFGAGHAYWLRHFVEQTPGFVLEEPLSHLK